MLRLIATLIVLLPVSLFGQAQSNTTQATAGMPGQQLSGATTPILSPFVCSSNLWNVTYYQTNAAAGRRFWNCSSADGVTGFAWTQAGGATAIGTSVAQTGLTTSLTSQTICPADGTCPAGLYHLDLYTNVTTGATLGSVTAVTVNYTDDGGSVGVNVASVTTPTCPSLILLTTMRCSVNYSFYKTANTSVTVSTTLGSLTGTPAYNFRAVLTQIQ